MYEVRSKVHGFLTFSHLGKAFGRYGQKAVMDERDLQDPEVKRALQAEKLEIVAERTPPDPAKGASQDVILSKKDWEAFRSVMLECADRINEKLDEKADEILEALARVPSPRVSLGDSPSGLKPQRGTRKVGQSEADYIITPRIPKGGSRVEVQESSEDGEDMLEGLAALRSLREDDGDGR